MPAATASLSVSWTQVAEGAHTRSSWPAPAADAAIGAVIAVTAVLFFSVMLLRKRRMLPPGRVHEESLGLLRGEGSAPEGGASPREGSIDAADIDDAVPTYVPGERIGRGGYGAVFEGRRNDGTAVAIKYVPMVTDEDEDATMEEVQAVMLLQGHPNIIPILAMNLNGRGVGNAPLDQRVADRMRRAMLRNTAGAGLFSESRCAIIVTPLYERGDIRRYVNTYASTHRHVPAAEAVRFAVQLCSAVRYAHDRKVVHRDLKPENMLLTVDGDMVLTDFGLSKIVERADQTLHTRAGSLPYVAPECFHGIYSSRVDNWSVGCVMYAIGAGRVNADNTRQMFQEVRRSSFEAMVRRDLAPYPTVYMEVTLGLVRFRPEDRMQLADAEAALSAIRL
jgi:serine/threonine protein kinase